MSQGNLTYDDLLRIVELIKTSEHFSEFRLKIGDVEVELRRQPTAGGSLQDAPDAASRTAADRQASPPAAVAAGPPSAGSPPLSARSTQAPTVSASWPAGSIVIRSPMVGTFYRSPEPGAPPFVDVGHAVEPGTIVCIIEVMKLMNSIPAGIRGSVIAILVHDASAVEIDQPLIVLRPEASGR